MKVGKRNIDLIQIIETVFLFSGFSWASYFHPDCLLGGNLTTLLMHYTHRPTHTFLFLNANIFTEATLGAQLSDKAQVMFNLDEQVKQGGVQHIVHLPQS